MEALCDGSGYIKDGCDECAGTGDISPWENDRVPCPECRGSGIKGMERCPGCSNCKKEKSSDKKSQR